MCLNLSRQAARLSSFKARGPQCREAILASARRSSISHMPINRHHYYHSHEPGCFKPQTASRLCLP